MSSLRFTLRTLFLRVRYFLKARIPERFLILTSYATNALIVAIQYLLLKDVGGESNVFVFASSVVVASQLFIPFYVMDTIPIVHYVVLISYIVAGVVLDLVNSFPAYYYLVALIVPFALLKMEPVFTTSPTVAKIATRVNRALKKARLPRSREEILFNVKLSSVYLVSVVISLLLYVIKGFLPSLVVTIYNLGIIAFVMLNIATNPMVKVPKEKYSLTLLFVMRYPLLFRLVNKMKMKLHPLTEKAGVWIYEVEYLSRYVALFFMYIMVLPTILVTLIVVLPGEIVMLASPPFLLIPLLIYYTPFISFKNKANRRKQLVEKEYPVFVAYASTMISAGVSLYNVFKDLASGKGSELLKGFTKEAKYVSALVEKQGMPEATALERYASQHPSQDVRNFVLGYIHQLQLGGRISQYLEQKLMEALDLQRRRMENFVKQIVMLTEIAITVLVLPMLPTILGFILAPDLMYNMLFVQMFLITPLMGFMFNNVAAAIQPEFRDEYKFTFIPSVIGGVIGLFVAFFMLPQKILAGVGIIIAGIALGYYLEFSRQRKAFMEIEKMLPQFFRDLSELRNMMPIAEAVKRMSHMNYPKSLSRILKSAASLREQGLRFTEQPWHSKSWFWKFTQFLVGKVEESGGGTPQIFRQLMVFFTEYSNIMYTARANLKVYEIVIYVIPVIFGIVMYTTIGIFAAVSGIGGEIMSAGELTAGIGMQFPQFARILQGVDPFVLTICDGLVIEMSLILGLLAGKVVSGTVKDTKTLAIAMIVSTAVIIFMPQFLQAQLAHLIPTKKPT